MKLDNSKILNIRDQFNRLHNYSDLCDLLNKVNSDTFSNEVKEIQLNEIIFYAYSTKAFYKHLSISKKSGGTRIISSPVKRLKEILKPLSIVLQCVYIPNECSQGFIWNKSILTNASCHIDKNYVYNIDLENFFPSIHQPRIYKRLTFEPFNLNNDKIKLASLISALCCFIPIGEIKGVLPQGSPTSPVISNIICDRLDRNLKGASKRFNVTYSRYANDITFSSNHNVYQSQSKFLKEVVRIINEQSFLINDSKTRLQKKGYRQVVTGLIVNEKINVHSKYIKELRALLYLIEKFGREKAQKIFSNYYTRDKKFEYIPKIEQVIEGKLEFLKMVKGEYNSTYLKLKSRFLIVKFQS